MRFAFFRVPVHDDGGAADGLNRFLASHRVLAVERGLIAAGQDSFWSLCVSYVPRETEEPTRPGRDAVDYREVLPADDFAVFARLRGLRNRIASDKGIPAFTIFTNAQLAAMVQQRVRTKAGMEALSGVGPAKVTKYAEAFLAALGEGTATAAEDGEGAAIEAGDGDAGADQSAG